MGLVYSWLIFEIGILGLDDLELGCLRNGLGLLLGGSHTLFGLCSKGLVLIGDCSCFRLLWGDGMFRGCDLHRSADRLGRKEFKIIRVLKSANL